MTSESIFKVEKDGIKVIGYPGRNKMLIAMSLNQQDLTKGSKVFAGFAITRKSTNGPEQVLSNRVSFDVGVSSATTAETRKWTPSTEAPFQKFRWVDVPPDGFTKNLQYRVTARYFTGNGKELEDGPEATLIVSPALLTHSKFKPAFTRGFIASQAYADRFNNADIRPKGAKIPDFDTTKYRDQYIWLGAEAHEATFAFLKDCEDDKHSQIDFFGYDLGCRLIKAKPQSDSSEFCKSQIG